MNVHDRAASYASASLQANLAKWRQEMPRKPSNYRRPPYESLHYQADFARGWITDEELDTDRTAHEAAEQARQQRSDRAARSRYAVAPEPTRWGRVAPKPSRQYANPMGLDAIHDDRLSMGAKALLVEIRARCGKGVDLAATKYALALKLNRSTRTIQRYLCDLARFGYITTKTRINAATGLYTGLLIKITEKVTPFWAKTAELAQWMADKGLSCIEAGQSLEFSDRTLLSYKNQPSNISSLIGSAFGPPKRNPLRGSV